MTPARLVLLVALIGLGLPACTHHVGFHPVEPPTELAAPESGRVDLYMSPEARAATYSFRAAGSGIANKWVVDYGARVHEFAQTYLRSAFDGFQEVSSPNASPDAVLLTLDNLEYSVSGQAANVALDAVATDASGRALLDQRYSKRGPSGSGAVFGGGAFAQKAVTRNSTNQALKELFLELAGDLGEALR